MDPATKKSLLKKLLTDDPSVPFAAECLGLLRAMPAGTMDESFGGLGPVEAFRWWSAERERLGAGNFGGHEQMAAGLGRVPAGAELRIFAFVAGDETWRYEVVTDAAVTELVGIVALDQRGPLASVVPWLAAAGKRERIYKVTVQSADGSTAAGEVLSYRDPLDEQKPCCLRLNTAADGVFYGRAKGAFEAMLALRRTIEAEGMRLLCFGARRDVWAEEYVGQDWQAFRTGKRAPGQMPPLQSIFYYSPPETIGTVAEQEENAERWLESEREGEERQK